MPRCVPIPVSNNAHGEQWRVVMYVGYGSSSCCSQQLVPHTPVGAHNVTMTCEHLWQHRVGTTYYIGVCITSAWLHARVARLLTLRPYAHFQKIPGQSAHFSRRKFIYIVAILSDTRASVGCACKSFVVQRDSLLSRMPLNFSVERVHSSLIYEIFRLLVLRRQSVRQANDTNATHASLRMNIQVQ